MQAAYYSRCNGSTGVLHYGEDQNKLSKFLRRCDAVHKEAQIILVRDILAIEADLEGLKGQPTTRENNSLISRLKYWKLLLVLFFNTFVWIALRLERNDVKRIAKGPKYGALKYQNIEDGSALTEGDIYGGGFTN